MMRSLAVTFLLLSLPAPILADRIVMKSGRVIEGTVLSRENGLVRIEAAGMETRFREDSIDRIETSAPFENSLLRARKSFRQREALRGIEFMLEAKLQGAPTERLSEVLEQGNGGINGAILGAKPSERPELGRTLRRMLEEDFQTSRTLFFASQNLYQLGDWDASADALGRIDDEDIARDPIVRTWALDVLRQLTRRQIARGEFESGLQYIERMKRLTGSARTEGGMGDAALPIALLATAAAARDEHRYAECFTIIAGDLSKRAPEIARNRAIFAIAHLRNWAEETKRFADARDAIVPLSKAFPVEYAATRNELLSQEASSLLGQSESGLALRILGTVPESQRTDELKSLYNRAFNDVEVTRIGDDKPLDLFKHGQWLVDNGMYEEAIGVLSRTAENAALKDPSEQLLTVARRERDTKLMEEAQKMFDLGNLTEAMNLAQKITSQENRKSEMEASAEKLIDLAKKSMRREAERRPYQAEVFYQQAERAYYMQNLEESLSMLNLILEQFKDTPAAGRAADLLPDVVRALELAFLEGKRDSVPAEATKVSLDSIRRDDQLGAELGTLMESLSNGGGKAPPPKPGGG